MSSARERGSRARQTRGPTSGEGPRARAGIAARTLLVLFFCAGLAMLGLLTGGDHPEAVARMGGDPMLGYFPQGMPRYPGVDEIPAGAESAVGGSRVRMSFFTTEDDPARVADHYAGHWRARRFFVREDISHVGGVVSAIDSAEGRVYQVLLFVRDGKTQVFPSVTTAPLSALDPATEPPPVPLFPESKAVIHLGSKESVGQARIILSTNEGGLKANVEHYERVLRAAGYRPESKNTEPLGPEHRVLLYRKEGSEVTVSLSALGGKRVRVHLTVVSS